MHRTLNLEPDSKESDVPMLNASKCLTVSNILHNLKQYILEYVVRIIRKLLIQYRYFGINKNKM